MYYAFWGIVVLMTVSAVFPILWSLRNGNEISIYAKILPIVFVPVLAGFLYWGLGDSRGLIHYWKTEQQVQAVQNELSSIKDPQQVINQLKGYLIKNPNHPEGWFLLGNIYYKEKRYTKAVKAFSNAHTYAPDNLAYTVAYARADFLDSKQILKPKTKRLLENVLRHDRNNVGALNLLAVDDYLSRNYKQAIDYWERLLPLFPENSEDKKNLLQMIANAQQKLKHEKE